MQTLPVSLGARSYLIHIGENLLTRADLLAPALEKSSQVVVVTNEVVAPLYLQTVQNTLQQLGRTVLPIILPDGEAAKNWNTLGRILDALLTARCDRRTPLIALGGGVIGDMTGFAAAIYQRGVPFIQIPTTLLAQVDSSVGGKTAVNHPLGKNMIGAFYQPRLVLADTRTLQTLPDRELSAGLAEVIKYGLIRDAAFFDWLEHHLDALLHRDPAALSEAILRSCQNKADVVAADETEQGERATLNLGHTFGHAIETGMGYGTWLHGEAVAAGMVMAADLSHRLGWFSAEELARTRHLLERARLPTKGAPLGTARYLELMALDKKVEAGALRLILLKGIGHSVIYAGASVAQITQTIEACCI